MADYLAFTGGKDLLLNSGIPDSCFFLLSTKTIGGSGGLTVDSTLAAGVGEITGTGYARQSQAAPVASGGTAAFGLLTWYTSIYADWPSGVRSVVLASSIDNTGVVVFAWHLQPGGGARNMAAPDVTEEVLLTMGLV